MCGNRQIIMYLCNERSRLKQDAAGTIMGAPDGDIVLVVECDREELGKGNQPVLVKCV